MNSNRTLILASNSPRRKQLLSDAGFEFQVKAYPVEEDYPESLPAIEVAEYLAKKKNKANLKYAAAHEVILTSDTVVIRDQTILGKPRDKDEAVKMIKSLSGISHDVMTGVCISDGSREESFSVRTTVHFSNLSEGEINHYVDTAKPYDKAGAYGIQEWIGLIAVTKIEGSFFNVVGLPTREVYEVLKRWGF